MNNKITSLAIGAVAVLALIFGATSYFGTPEVQSVPQVVKGPQGERGPAGPQGPVGPVGPRGPAGTSEKVGALTGPDIPYPYISVGGVATYFSRGALQTATTTPCAIATPPATSTLMYSGVNITTATSTATTWTVAWSTSPYLGSTTPLAAAFSLASGAQGSFDVVASSTATAANSVGGILPPNSYLVWTVAGTRPADSTKLNGTCQAEFRAI